MRRGERLTNPRRLLICSSGLPGSGKGIVLRAAENLDLSTFVMGDFVRNETQRRGMEPTPKNTGAVMKRLREEHGPRVIAELTLQEIDKTSKSVALVDGVRSMDELEYFESHGWDTFTIAVIASPDVRFRRLSRRGRADDVTEREEFTRREQREISVGIRDVLLSADAFIVNENRSQDEILAEAEEKLREILGGA